MNEPPVPANPSPPDPDRVLPGGRTDVHRRSSAGAGDAGGLGGVPSAVQRERSLRVASIVVLCPVAGIGAALSFQSLHEAAAPIFGPLAFGFPLLVDMLILGSTLAYLAGATVGRALPGWRWTAHGAVTGTLLLNALAASGPATIAWHITPAVVWSVLVEMAARQVTGRWTTDHAPASEPIPARIWLISPVLAGRTWLHMARTAQRSHRQARADLAVHAAAVQALKTCLPERGQRRTRRLIGRQLRAGALDPTAVLNHLHGHDANPLAANPAALLLTAFLSEGLSHEPPRRSDETQGAAADSWPPRSPIPTTEPSGRPPTRSQPHTPRPSGTSAVSGGDHPGGSAPAPLSTRQRETRRQAVTEILRTRPDIDGPDLARALTDLGWPVTRRTARRVHAQASLELASASSAGQQAVAGGETVTESKVLRSPPP